MATSIEISEARKAFNSLDERLKRDRVIYVRRHRKPAFAMVDLKFLDAAHAMMDVLADPLKIELIEQAMKEIRAGKPPQRTRAPSFLSRTQSGS